MKPRKRPISNLYHRWGSRLQMHSYDVAKALEEAELVELVFEHFVDKPSHYIETDKMLNIPRPLFETTIRAVLEAYHGRS